MRSLQTSSSATMDAAQWTHQGIGVVKDVEITGTRVLQLQGENKRVRPYKEQALNCPRCNSTNTKFCYYNNYSLSQPRYFCKTCRRYWTEGGSLRNVPVGGGSRKNKKPSFSSSSSSPASATATTFPASSSLNLNPSDLIPIPQIPLQSSKLYDQDLNLAHYGFVPAPESCPGFGGGFGFQELMRQTNVKLPLGDNHGGYSGGSMQEGGTGRLLFPFEDLRQIQLSNGGREDGQNAGSQDGQDPSLFW